MSPSSASSFLEKPEIPAAVDALREIRFVAQWSKITFFVLSRRQIESEQVSGVQVDGEESPKMKYLSSAMIVSNANSRRPGSPSQHLSANPDRARK